MALRMHAAPRTNDVSRRARLAASIALMCLGGCTRRPSLADAAHGVPPFESLAAVHLGMRADEFVHARPGVAVLMYSGYQETIAGFHAMYQFTRPAIVRNAIPAGRLESVTMTRDVATEPSARQAWDSLLAAGVRGFRRPPDSCWVARGPLQVRAWAAVWDAPADVVVVGESSMPEKVAAAVGESPARVGVTMLTPDHADQFAALQQRRRIDCPK